MKNERTLKMMENYPHHYYDEGMEPKEIAKLYNLSVTTVYSCLEEIAEKLGVPREELLKKPHDEHIMGARNFEPVKPVDVSEFRKRMQAYAESVAELKSEMAKTIEEHEMISEYYSEKEGQNDAE